MLEAFLTLAEACDGPPKIACAWFVSAFALWPLSFGLLDLFVVVSIELDRFSRNELSSRMRNELSSKWKQSRG